MKLRLWIALMAVLTLTATAALTLTAFAEDALVIEDAPIIEDGLVIEDELVIEDALTDSEIDLTLDDILWSPFGKKAVADAKQKPLTCSTIL